MTVTVDFQKMRLSAIEQFSAMINNDMESTTGTTLALSFEDKKIRDAILWLMIEEQWDLDRVLVVMEDLIASFEDDAHISGAKTVAAITYWMMGDTYYAMCYLNEVLDIVDDYGLALMIREAIKSRIPVSFWTETVSDLTFDQVMARNEETVS